MLSGTKLKLKPSNARNAHNGADSERWKILIVDDEKAVHAVTKFALKGYRFAGRDLDFLHAYSAAEARDILSAEAEIALVLLDVVMESDNAGLDIVRFIRGDQGNKFTRIVLRTGQPGHAPERRVIMDYDINDYKEKTELTSQKLFTLMSASLRAYQDMIALDRHRRSLRTIIETSTPLYRDPSMHHLAEGALDQLMALLFIHNDTQRDTSSLHAFVAVRAEGDFEIVAGTGRYQQLSASNDVIPSAGIDMDRLIKETAASGVRVSDHEIICHHRGRQGHETIIYLAGDVASTGIDPEIIRLYAKNIGIIFENSDLNRQVEETQREIVYRLGEAVETRSMETGNHLKRVSEFSKLIALKMGLSEEEAELLRYAAPLHDVGKIGIPDAILNKPGPLDPHEWEIMQTHSALGHKMLASSKKPVLKAGAIIALDHHERWDGTGYPGKKAGEDIHLYGRITALADVFDALAHHRTYKNAWNIDDIRSYIESESGKHFQPELVDIFTANIKDFEAILEKYRDD